MTKEIPEKLKTKKYVKLRSISISEEQSKWLYENKVSPQALLSDAIDSLMKDE